MQRGGQVVATAWIPLPKPLAGRVVLRSTLAHQHREGADELGGRRVGLNQVDQGVKGLQADEPAEVEPLAVDPVALLEHRHQQLLLAGEMVQQPGVREPGNGCDPGQGGPRVSVGGVGLQGRADHPIASRGTSRGSRSTHLVVHADSSLANIPTAWLVIAYLPTAWLVYL